MVWDLRSVEGLRIGGGSIAKTDSKASLRELDIAKRHGERRRRMIECKYDWWRIEDRRGDIWESRDRERGRVVSKS